MISLRSFRPDDWQVVTKHQYPDMGQDDAVRLIDEWNQESFQGRFQKMLAIDDNKQIVGYVSMIEQSAGVISIGVEVYAPFRRHGYAYAGVSQICTMANALNYHTATWQVRKDNTASLALCKKLGFRIVDEGISKRGHPVYNLAKSI